LLALGLLGILIADGSRICADPPKPSSEDKKAPAEAKKPVAVLPSAVISEQTWQKAARTPLKVGEIDQLLAAKFKEHKITPAKLTSDEQFIRRVTLDLTGHLPMPADVEEFLADKSPNKRAKLIDSLLETDEYAEHWARYWSAVISTRLPDLRGQLLVRSFNKWLAGELKKNTSWGDITSAMITAEGSSRLDEPDKNGQNFFLLSRFGADANTERAAETSRVFLGMQIQCAQCHDHPSDIWKRQQFHEFAAHFGRLAPQPRPIRDGMRLVGFQLASRPFGEYQMPDKDNPKKSAPIDPRFLNGKATGAKLTDKERRQKLAKAIIDKENYWFAGAYVNRIWGELLGQSFYQPVDDMGPQKEAVFGDVLARIAGSFRGSNYDIKGLFRTIMNSQAYQRQIRLGESTDEHVLFAGIYPTRLRGDALWQSLVDVLGKMGGPPPARPGVGGPFAGFQGLENLFKQEFNFDPSTKSDEVEGSIPQALLLMNNPVINQRIKATGTNLLARVLKSYPKDDTALRLLYLRALSRRPTEKELSRCLAYVSKVGNRAEAFEDILWTLLNSTEFQTRR
jgi:hypothetical protein